MEIEVKPTKKVVILGLDKRPLEDIIWCASTYNINRLFWIDGYLLCTEVYEKAFEHEITKNVFTIRQVCYAEFPRYRKFYEVEKGVHLPIVNVTGVKLFTNLLKSILEEDEKSRNR
ncbi:MAG: hypothetical protein JSV51_03415 [Candidatus Bathyarchaeota archaeon]|nr:MAG: hypothetical protein JSV51_03415 [Candidatus Bathyarchaeota archaeon]